MADLVGQGRIAVQFLTVRRHHFHHLRLPFRRGQTALECRLQHLDHDRRRGRRAWRGAQQGNDAAIGGTDDFRAELQQAAFDRVILDDLHALAGVLQGPVFHLGSRQIFAQGLQAVFRRIHHLLDQVFGQRNIVVAGLQHRLHIARADRTWQVGPRTVFQELRRERGKRAKQQGFLAIDDARVQMRHGHRRRTDGCLAVDLGRMRRHQLRVGRHQPLAADRHAAVALGFRNARLFQQRQRTAARADEDELGAHGLFLATGQVLDLDVPHAIGAALDVFHLVAQVQDHAMAVRQVFHEAAREVAEVDVGTDVHARCRHFLALVAALHDERRPLRDLRLVFRIQHTLEQVFLLQRGVALLQKGNIIVAPDKSHVRHIVDEGLRRAQVLVGHLVGPELLGNFELLVDGNGLLRFDAAIGRFRRVVQFGKRRVARARVVHRVRTFGGDGIEALDHFHRQRRVEFLEHAAQGGAHGAGAHQQHVDRFFGRGRRCLVTCRQDQARHQK
ncbi:hypothetical protein D3C81_677730 [compost metagenome]